MSDFDELLKEYLRALELGDRRARAEIADAMLEEARSYGLDELADRLEYGLRHGDYREVNLAIAGMGAKAAQIDRDRHDGAVDGLLQAELAADLAVWNATAG